MSNQADHHINDVRTGTDVLIDPTELVFVNNLTKQDIGNPINLKVYNKLLRGRNAVFHDLERNADQPNYGVIWAEVLRVGRENVRIDFRLPCPLPV